MSEENKNEIPITYETLFELCRRERSRQDIQELTPTFILDVQAYLRDKDALLNSETNEEQKNRLTTQIRNIKRITRSLHECREAKILTLAMNRARTGSSLVSSSCLLEAEQTLFSALVALLSDYRVANLSCVTNNNGNHQESLPPEAPKPDEPDRPEAIRTVRFLTPVQQFIGPSLESYGPFESQETAELPAKIAETLVKKGKAEEVSSEK